MESANARRVRDMFKTVFNECRIDRLEDYYERDCEFCDIPATELQTLKCAHEGSTLHVVRDTLVNLREGMSDLVYTVGGIYEDGNTVIVRWSATARHTGTFMGSPPTDEMIELRGISICEFRNGRICKVWQQLDMMSVLQQIGALSPMAVA